MQSVEVTEAQSSAVAVSQKTRVSLADIEANIAAENTFIASDALGALGQPVHEAHKLLTICVITLSNGFTVLGKTAPADALNFNEELGRKFAREDAVRQIWPLMGYALRERQMEKAQTLAREESLGFM
jgi:hypothetical protein